MRGKNAVQQVIGVGHKAFEQAVRQAVDDTACVACISSNALPRRLVAARAVDRVTGGESPVRSVVFAAEQSERCGTWSVLRDWQLVQRLNDLIENITVLRKPATPPQDQTGITADVDAAVAVLNREAPLLGTSFRVPSLELIAVLWPGKEVAHQHDEQGREQQDSEEFLD